MSKSIYTIYKIINTINDKVYVGQTNGKTLSDETKKKMSVSHMNIKHTDETKRKISLSNSGNCVGEENSRFKGYYHTPFGKLTSAYYIKSYITTLGDNTLQRWYKNSDKEINKRMISKSPYLKSLKESPLNKTFKDVGFWFEPK